MDMIGFVAGALALLALVQQANAGGKVVKSAKPVEQRFAVDMWWSIGGDLGGLKKSSEGCAKKLGEPEAPALASPTILTKSMLDCLEGEGWRPLGAPRPA
jgi:hypothetical protein